MIQSHVHRRNYYKERLEIKTGENLILYADALCKVIEVIHCDSLETITEFVKFK